MGAVVADTHAIIWYLSESAQLSSRARAAFDEAAQTGDPVYVASISLIEVAYLVEKGKVTDEALEQLYKALADPDSGFVVVPLTLVIAQTIRRVPRDRVPDMPDRIIAATALYQNLPLVTRDQQIQAAIPTIW